MKSLYEQVALKSLQVPCVILRTIEVEYDDGNTSDLEIVQGNKHTKSCIGIHTHSPSEYSLNDSIETAIKDGFKRIYIYGGAK